MHSRAHHFPTLLTGLVLALFGPALGALAASGHAAEPASSTNAAALAQVEIPQSVYAVPGTPKEGRNPFFPQSTMGQEAPPKIKEPTPVAEVTTGLVLNGITSPPKRTAMINSRTFEPGEEGEVRLPNGAKVLIKCEEIKGDAAVIVVAGQRRELRLRFGL